MIGLTACGSTAVSAGTAEAASAWKGPFSSRATCVASSGENRGLQWINVKIACQFHNTDKKWWYQTRW